MGYLSHDSITLGSSLYRFYWLFFACLYREVRNQDLFRFTLYRALVLLLLLFALPSLIMWNHAGFWLDDVLFHQWADEEIVAPLFIVGNARSGTTFFHRLVATETFEDQAAIFTTARTWEIVFGQSVTWRILFTGLFRLDRRLCGGLCFSLLLKAEKCLCGDIHVHQVGLQEAEEDEWVMACLSLSQLLMFFFPQGGHLLDPLVLFDYRDSVPKTTRRAIFRFYRNFVRRHLYARRLIETKQEGARRRLIYISKNPPFTMRLESLLATFPDARVICLVRDPSESVPSMVSYIGKVWAAFASPVIDYPDAAGLLAFCEAHYAYPNQVFGTPDILPSSQCTTAYYKELVAKPSAEVMRVLRGVYGTERDFSHLSRRLKRADEDAASKAYQSKHQYTLEGVTGKTPEELRILLKPIYDKNKF